MNRFINDCKIELLDLLFEDELISLLLGESLSKG